jgi:DNA replication protein
MIGFSGFPDGKVGLTNIPDLFFSELLPIIEDLSELKVTLYAFWSLSQKEGSVRFLRMADFIGDKLFLDGMGSTQSAALKSLEEGIELAVARGTFLMVTADTPDGSIELLFLNTEKGRALVDGVISGEWRPDLEDGQPTTLMVNRPNIYVVYEQNIGTLTPMIADQLRDAEKTYPYSWIEEAVQLAVENNVRKWSYVSSILERWRQEGKRDGISRRDSQKELKQQVPEEFRDIIKR